MTDLYTVHENIFYYCWCLFKCFKIKFVWTDCSKYESLTLFHQNKCSLSKRSDGEWMSDEHWVLWYMLNKCLAQSACFVLQHMRLHLYITQVGSHLSVPLLLFCLLFCPDLFFYSSTQIKPKHIFCLLWKCGVCAFCHFSNYLEMHWTWTWF